MTHRALEGFLVERTHKRSFKWRRFDSWAGERLPIKQPGSAPNITTMLFKHPAAAKDTPPNSLPTENIFQ